MPPRNETPDTILIVDDEELVRRTLREWLEGAHLGCTIRTAGDAESALQLAEGLHGEHRPIDLAVLDWNLGAGTHGLQLLEDLTLFHPDVVAIMVTAYAHQATPLDAMRMGVRDYLDKNQDLNRDTFLRAVRRQLERIRPAKRERRIHDGLVAFRAAVEKAVPLVQASAALQDPVPLPEAVRSLLGFLLRSTGARDGVLLLRSYEPGRQPAEVYRAYDATGQPLSVELAPFARSVAGSVASLQEPYTMDRPEQAGALELQPFERGRRALLAAPLSVGPGLQAVLELFDKEGPDGPLAFTEADRQLTRAAADLGAEMLRQALAERQAQRVLAEALAAALEAGDAVAQSLEGGPPPRPEDPPPASVLERLREGLEGNAAAAVDAGPTLRLAEAIRVLALRYGPPAVAHCTALVEGLRKLLDETTGAGEGSP
jgi:ActR/RegA family two-component response regulator